MSLWRVLRLFIPSVLVIGIFACGQEPEVIPVRNLERPSDMQFVCVEETLNNEGKPVVTARPITRCHPPPRNERREPPVDLKDRTIGTFSLVTNTARGEVAVVDLNTGRLVDLDPISFGFNMVPVGKMPETIDVSTDGCQAVTTNRASCDLSLIDTPRLLAPLLRSPLPSTGNEGRPVVRVVPVTDDGRLAVSPHEAVFLPEPVDDASVCGPPGEKAKRRRIIATFPACDLVALLELPGVPPAPGEAGRARVVDSVRIARDRIERLGPNPRCPVECGDGAETPPDGSASGGAAGTGSADGGAADAGAAGAPAPTTGAAPGTGRIGVGPLAVVPGGSFVYVGAFEAPIIAVVEVKGDELQIPPAPIIPLSEGAAGAVRLRLTVDPFDLDARMTLGKFVGDRGKFLYAFARDSSVRVVNLTQRLNVDAPPPAGNASVEQECDVNIEPASLTDPANEAKEGCFPVVAAPDSKPHARRPLAEGPGLRIPVSAGDAPPPVPRDITFATIESDTLGYLVASNGQVYIIHIDSTGGQVELTHSFRDTALELRDDQRGPPRTTRPQRQLSTNEIPFATRATFPTSLAGPRLESVYSPTLKASTWAWFPSESGVVRQVWSVIWEDILPATTRTGGRLDVTTPARAPGIVGTLEDVGAHYCRSGVVKGDVLAVVGCQRDADCGPMGTRGCYQTAVGNNGICLTRDQAREEASERRCTRFLSSMRRYEIREASRSRLVLGLRLDEVPKTALNPPQKDEDCRPTAAHENNDRIPGDEGFKPIEVFPGQGVRCVERCGSLEEGDDRRCRTGHVCEDVGSQRGRFCVEAPPIDPACFPEGTRTRIQAGQSFIVSGGATPRPATELPDPTTERCNPDLARNPLLVERIPLSAPACRPMTADPDNPPTIGVPMVTDGVLDQQKPPGASDGVMAWGNPCLYRATNNDQMEEPVPGQTPEQAPVAPKHVKAYFQNPQMRLVVTNLEQYTGDFNSILFSVNGGFAPERVSSANGDVLISLGARIVTAPTRTRRNGSAVIYFPHIFVIDQGRTRSDQSRGQVIRIQPRTDRWPEGYFESRYSNSTFPIQ